MIDALEDVLLQHATALRERLGPRSGAVDELAAAASPEPSDLLARTPELVAAERAALFPFQAGVEADSPFQLLPDWILALAWTEPGALAAADDGLWTRETTLSWLREQDDPPRAGVAIDLRSALDDASPGAAFLAPDFRERLLVTLVRTADGWRRDGVVLRQETWETAYRLERQASDGAWRVRRPGDEVPARSRLELRLVVVAPGVLVPDEDGSAHLAPRGRDVRLERGDGARTGAPLRAGPGRAEADLADWLAPEPATVDIRLVPAAGTSYADVILALDALISAGAVHLSLELPAGE